MPTRRQLLAASAAGYRHRGCVGSVSRARAQAVSKPVRIMVGFPAGGGTDMIARILAERLRGPYASAVLVENKAGRLRAARRRSTSRTPSPTAACCCSRPTSR